LVAENASKRKINTFLAFGLVESFVGSSFRLGCMIVEAVMRADNFRKSLRLMFTNFP
jgi:hypothetical protein